MTDTPVAAEAPTSITPAAVPAAADSSPAAAPITEASGPLSGSAPDSPPASSAAAQSSPADSATSASSGGKDSSPSLLSSADGKTSETKDAPKEQPAPAAEPAKVEAKDAPKEPEAKPADATDPAKPADAIQPPALVKLDELKLPEGVTLAEKESQAFLDTINDAKLDGKGKAQNLLDLHVAEIKRVADQAAEHQRKVWTDTNDGWKNEFRKDPEVGGSKSEASLRLGKAVIDDAIPEPEIRERIYQYLNYSGMGNHPDMIRLFARLGKQRDVFEDGSNTANARPPNPPKGPGNRGWYPTMGGDKAA